MDNIYTIYGNDDLMIKQKLNSILSSYANYNIEEINLDLEETSIITLLEEINMIPFLSEYKFVVIKNLTFFNSKKVDVKLVNSFIEYLSNPISSTILVIMVDDRVPIKYINLLKNKTNFTKIEKTTEEEVYKILEDYITNKGYFINKRSLDELILRTNNDFNRALIEIDKIILYKDMDKEININDINLLVSKDLNDNVFDLLNALLEKNKAKILSLYNEISVCNDDDLRIITMLLSRFNEIYQTKTLVSSGVSKEEIASIFNVKSGRAYYMMKNATQYNASQIKDNINKLLDLEYKIKSGQIDKHLGLELYLLQT